MAFRRRSPRRSRCGAIDFPRLVIAVVMIFVLVATLTWLQGRFETSDHKKAVETVRSYRATPTGPTIPAAIARRHPAMSPDDISWSSEITSGCLGHVRVFAYVPRKRDSGSTTYAFDVNLTDPSIHPTDPVTVDILKSLTATTTGTTTASLHSGSRPPAPPA